jgi:hypothetical protein
MEGPPVGWARRATDVRISLLIVQCIIFVHMGYFNQDVVIAHYSSLSCHGSFKKLCVAHEAVARISAPRGRTQPNRRMIMQGSVRGLIAAAGMALAVTLSAVTAAFAQQAPNTCVPQYDNSGAQIAPYC